MLEKYGVNSLKKGARNPNLILQEIESITTKRIFERKAGSGVDVMDRDWDNLIILDACRFDTFRRTCEIRGNYSTVISKGTIVKASL